MNSFAFIALGSNVGDSGSTILRAMGRLEEYSASPLHRSSLWQTSPVDCPGGAPHFVNAAVALLPRSDETPETMLAKLQALEREFGRKPKSVLNEPRPLDLDLIAFGGQVRSQPELTLPHPRASHRRFVLQPLSEIAPELVLPGQKETVQQLLDGLANDECVVRLE